MKVNITFNITYYLRHINDSKVNDEFTYNFTTFLYEKLLIIVFLIVNYIYIYILCRYYYLFMLIEVMKISEVRKFVFATISD